jgi:hypothetical protein
VVKRQAEILDAGAGLDRGRFSTKVPQFAKYEQGHFHTWKSASISSLLIASREGISANGPDESVPLKGSLL